MCLHFHKNLLEITITQIIGQVDITFTPREATESHKNIYKNTQSYRFKAHNQNCMCVCVRYSYDCFIENDIFSRKAILKPISAVPSNKSTADSRFIFKLLYTKAAICRRLSHALLP